MENNIRKTKPWNYRFVVEMLVQRHVVMFYMRAQGKGKQGVLAIIPQLKCYFSPKKPEFHIYIQFNSIPFDIVLI